MKYRIKCSARGNEKGDIDMAKSEPLSAKETAMKLGTDARTLRKFLRATREGVGQGNRWSIESSGKEMVKLTKEFEAWEKNKGKSARQVEPKLKTLTADDEDLDEVEDILDSVEDEHLDDVEFETQDDEDEVLELEDIDV